jgi:NTP pyrophosphatase (non-canonical NTP hydrolase)
MDFDEYQEKAKKTAIYPDIGEKFVYPVIGLVGEAGEIANKVKKIFRDKGGKIDFQTKEDLKKELGDVLWYVSQVATDMEIKLNDIATSNIEKLASRMHRNQIKGSGDDR